MGLPAFKIVSAVNENDEFYRFIQTGNYSPLPQSIRTISNAMDIANPSNLIRLFYHFGGKLERTGRVLKPLKFEKLEKIADAGKATDEETIAALQLIYKKHKFWQILILLLD